MANDLKQKLTSAHAAMGYEINRGVGIKEASAALGDAIDAYYGAIYAVMDAQAVESYLTQWNVSVDDRNALNREFMVLS